MINKKLILPIIVLLLGCYYLLVLQVSAIWPFTIDDMYISLRYAKHWAAGQGLLWNIGESPVEGYSNFSFVALAALAIKMHFDPVFLLKGLGALGLVLSTLGIYCLSRLWFTTWVAFIPCMWMLLYNGQILWAVSGLETTIYQALICFALFFLLRGMGYSYFPRTREKTVWYFLALTGFLLALAGMTRPEAPALMLIFYSLAIFDSPATMRKDYYKALLFSGLILVFLFAPYFFWRWQYYRRLFPNAVYCKGFTHFSLALDLQYLRLAWPFLLLAIPAIVSAQDKRHYFLWLPTLVYLVLLMGADPVVAFANRLFLPVFILLLPLTLQGIICVLRYWLPQEDSIYYISLLAGVFFVAFFFIPKMTLANYRYFTQNPQAGLLLRQKVVDWLNRHIKKGSQVLLGDSGMIPYLSSLNFIDSYCLNNKNMTGFSGQNMYQWLCNESFKMKPDVIILTSLLHEGRIIYTPTDFCLQERLKNNQLYKFRTIYETGDQKSTYRYEIYTLSN